MVQEEKELLLKDLCARLPYEVICQMEDKLIINDSQFYDYTLSGRHIDLIRNHKNFYIKPYLRPLSSMTEDEYNELKEISSYYGLAPFEDIHNWTPNYNLIDWLNAHHFDYRGLIEKGLALKAKDGMYNN